MQDATITQEQTSQSLQGRFPSVVTTDDLVFELGKQIVDKLNKEKLLEGLLKKKQQAESQIVDIEKIKADAKKQIAGFQESNRLYEENNRKLDSEIVKLRKEISGLQSENTDLKASLKPKRKLTSKKKANNV